MAKRAPSGNPSEEENRINTPDVPLLDLFAETEVILAVGERLSRASSRSGVDGALSATSFPGVEKFTKPL
jgi:hypothetical protein